MSCNVIAQNQPVDVEDSVQSQPVNQAQSSRPIEQIIITTERSFHTLRLHIDNAEDSLYATFNDLNIDDDFDVDCGETDYTHTHIQDHVCVPAFFNRLIFESTQDSLGFWGARLRYLQAGTIAPGLSEKFDELDVIMLDLANEHDSLAEALIELWTLRQEFIRRKEECMQTPAVLFLFRRC